MNTKNLDSLVQEKFSLFLRHGQDTRGSKDERFYVRCGNTLPEWKTRTSLLESKVLNKNQMTIMLKSDLIPVFKSSWFADKKGYAFLDIVVNLMHGTPDCESLVSILEKDNVYREIIAAFGASDDDEENVKMVDEEVPEVSRDEEEEEKEKGDDDDEIYEDEEKKENGDDEIYEVEEEQGQTVSKNVVLEKMPVQNETDMYADEIFEEDVLFPDLVEQNPIVASKQQQQHQDTTMKQQADAPGQEEEEEEEENDDDDFESPHSIEGHSKKEQRSNTGGKTLAKLLQLQKLGQYPYEGEPFSPTVIEENTPFEAAMQICLDYLELPKDVEIFTHFKKRAVHVEKFQKMCNYLFHNTETPLHRSWCIAKEVANLPRYIFFIRCLYAKGSAPKPSWYLVNCDFGAESNAKKIFVFESFTSMKNFWKSNKDKDYGHGMSILVDELTDVRPLASTVEPGLKPSWTNLKSMLAESVSTKDWCLPEAKEYVNRVTTSKNADEKAIVVRQSRELTELVHSFGSTNLSKSSKTTSSKGGQKRKRASKKSAEPKTPHDVTTEEDEKGEEEEKEKDDDDEECSPLFKKMKKEYESKIASLEKKVASTEKKYNECNTKLKERDSMLAKHKEEYSVLQKKLSLDSQKPVAKKATDNTELLKAEEVIKSKNEELIKAKQKYDSLVSDLHAVVFKHKK